MSLVRRERATRSYAAKVVGRDTLTDSALIQLTEMPTQPLTEVKFGDSAQMQPGDWVMAIGNPFSLGHTRQRRRDQRRSAVRSAASPAARAEHAADRRGDQSRATPAARCSTSAAKWSA